MTGSQGNDEIRARHKKAEIEEFASSEVHHEGPSAHGDPDTGEVYVQDANEATEIRGEHPIQPAEGPAKKGYETYDKIGDKPSGTSSGKSTGKTSG